MSILLWKTRCSKSAIALRNYSRQNNGQLRLMNTHSRRPLNRAKVLNWGSTAEVPLRARRCLIINHPNSVVTAVDKRLFFNTASHRVIQGLPAPRVPEHTESSEVALEWLREGSCVFARTLTRASSGRGIVEMNSPEDLVQAPLYVKYIKKANEFRVHVFGDDIIQVDRKAKSRGIPNEQVNWKIRNNSNGFIFERNVNCPDDVKEQAKLAIQICELDFGAVDIIWNNHFGMSFVIEVNTAPGLEGVTLGNYYNEIIRRWG